MGSKWKTLDFDDVTYEKAPVQPGVYVFTCDGVCSYIGQTLNLHSRIHHSHAIRYAHYSNSIITPWGRFSSVQVKYRCSRRYGEWLMAEARLIRRLKPRFNTDGVRARRSRYAGKVVPHS